jgi:rhamnosyltransferase
MQSVAPQQVIVIDSSSTDGTVAEAVKVGFRVIQIDVADFDHGRTRQQAAECAPDAEIVVYLTQDAILCDKDSFKNILTVFEDQTIGAAYGRQLPRPNALPLEAHARLFNYPTVSRVRSWESRSGLGLKSVFFSNSFGAYRRDALMKVGGFPSDVIMGEDTLVAARLHKAGWKTAYVAEALVFHSHSYSVAEEFGRCFDTGVMHSREKWLIENFGTATGEGWRFLLSEFRYLLRHDLWSVPAAWLRAAAKYSGYQLGRHEERVAPSLKRRLAMNKNYWNHRREPAEHSV